MNVIRQGDVLLLAVDSLPEGEYREIAPVNGRLIVAEGEATGHAHVLEGDSARMVEFADGERYILVDAPVPMTHDEHDAAQLSRPTYRVVHQREYAPMEIRRVID